MGNPNLTHIQKLLNLPDPLLDFKWICRDGKLPFGLPSEYLESIDLPFLNIRIKEGVFGGSRYTYYPGFHDISSFSVNFYEDSQGNVTRWLWQWKNRIKDFKTGIYNLPSDYKRNLNIQLLDTNNTPVINASLIGVWPADTSNYQLNYTNNGRIIVGQTFSIDNQELEFLVSSTKLF